MDKEAQSMLTLAICLVVGMTIGLWIAFRQQKKFLFKIYGLVILVIALFTGNSTNNDNNNTNT